MLSNIGNQDILFVEKEISLYSKFNVTSIHITPINYRFSLYLLTVVVIGAGLNIFVFLVEQNYRKHLTTFFFHIGSINSLFHLLFKINSRILSVSYRTNLSDISLFICKIRMGLWLLLVSNHSLVFIWLQLISVWLHHEINIFIHTVISNGHIEFYSL